jgi:hypothetical protein
MAKYQVNLTVTLINSKLIDDDTLRKGMKLRKNGVPAFNVGAIVAALREQLSDYQQSVRRSNGGNLSITLPVKVEGNFLTKSDTNAKQRSPAKKTDEEKRAALKADLGL